MQIYIIIDLYGFFVDFNYIYFFFMCVGNVILYASVGNILTILCVTGIWNSKRTIWEQNSWKTGNTGISALVLTLRIPPKRYRHLSVRRERLLTCYIFLNAFHRIQYCASLFFGIIFIPYHYFPFHSTTRIPNCFNFIISYRLQNDRTSNSVLLTNMLDEYQWMLSIKLYVEYDVAKMSFIRTHI